VVHEDFRFGCEIRFEICLSLILAVYALVGRYWVAHYWRCCTECDTWRMELSSDGEAIKNILKKLVVAALSLHTSPQ